MCSCPNTDIDPKFALLEVGCSLHQVVTMWQQSPKMNTETETPLVAGISS